MYRWLHDRSAVPAERPLLVFGNQKSGTSAIASLLAIATGKSVLIDLFYRFGGAADPVLRGQQPLAEIWNRSSAYLNRDILKEPEFVLFADDLDKLYPRSPRLFIVREPLDNLRSILNRLDCPGTAKQISPALRRRLGRQAPLWLPVVDGPRPGWTGEDLIETLALRWKNAAQVYLRAPRRFQLVTYESFLADKVGRIGDIAQNLGWPVLQDISSQVSRPFQPAGKRVSPTDFFGTETTRRIVDLCGPEMEALGYDTHQGSPPEA